MDDFWDTVRRLVEEKKICERWRCQDIMPHLIDRYAESTITTYPANYCEGGNYVQSGKTPKVRRIEKGLYELLGK